MALSLSPLSIIGLLFLTSLLLLILSLFLSFSNKNLLFASNVRCNPCQHFFFNEIFHQAQNEIAKDIFQELWNEWTKMVFSHFKQG